MEGQLKVVHIETGENIDDWKTSINPEPQIQIPAKNKGVDIDAVEQCIKDEFPIKRNCITRAYELNGKEIESEDFNTIFIFLKKQFPRLSREIFDTIIFSNLTETYDPLKNYFDSLLWDNKDRLTELTKCINSDTGTFDYRRILLLSWLLGMIETVYTGEPNVLQLILAGLQNTGKSVFFKELLPIPLRKYLAFSQLDKGKDDEILMCQKLLIIDDEFSGKSKQDAKLIKYLLSANSFTVREPYGRKNVTFRRIATLGATSNETELLNDPTGNRRNIIFEIIGKFDFDLYNSIDKEQLFAQLVKMHIQGYKAALTQPMIDLIKQYTADKHGEVNIESECIIKFFEPPSLAAISDFLTTTEIKVIIENATMQKLNLKKLGGELKRLGYQRIQQRNKGYGYSIVRREIVITGNK